MKEEKIIGLLESLHEHKMAKEIFVPVLRKMGLKGVRFTGGSDEQGIDIEYFELTEPEKLKSYVGVQFKKGDLKYSARGGKNTIKEIKNQAEEAFEKEIVEYNSSAKHFINRYVVATTGEINGTARTMINKARGNGKDRSITYWDGERLVEYITDYYLDEFIQYFNIKDDEAEEDYSEMGNVINQEYIENNYKELIRTCNKVKATVNSSEWEILYAILDIIMFRGEEATLQNILFELEKSEDWIQDDLRHLIQSIGYLDLDDYVFTLIGKAVELENLAKTIKDELFEAEEDQDNAKDIFDSLV